MTESISKFHRTESEQLHAVLYELHWVLYRKAMPPVATGLAVLHKLEVEHSDVRSQCRSYIAEFESLLGRLEKLLHDAADFRSLLILENGCDNSCHEGLRGGRSTR